MTTALLIFVILLLAVILLAGGFLFYIYWRLVQRPTSRLDGAVKVACLEQPVEILRDRHAIPHIYAQNRADLFRAQGYVHAQDRLWQMEQNRRTARGALAEIFGEAALDADRFSRIVGFWRAAEKELTTLDAETRQVLDWYAQGVNAYIQSRPGKLAAEFNLLRFTPQPWQAVDTLAYGKLMGWALSLNWEGELTRLRLIEQLDPVRAADLEPDYPGKNPIILEGVGSAESTRLLATAGLLLNEYEKVKQWLGDWRGQGSNSWVLSPKNSLNRRPLLCNDPHLGVQIPGVWYENHLICPDYEVSGASFPGAPGVIIGHNAHIAWGMTNAGPDVQDLYIERAHEEDATRFEFAGQWEQAQVMDEAILVKGWPQPHHERVVITRHGPLISGLLERSPVSATLQAIPLALRWVGHEPGQMTRAILRLNQAKNWEDFDSALADWSVPAQNVTYADVEGNIGYIMAGKAPVRDKNLGLTPAPGWDGDHEWSGHIPHGDLPRLYNPPSGKIVTANNKMVGDDYPYFLGVEFLPGWRAARLEEMLRTKDRYTIRDMEEMQLDTTSKFAQSLTPWIALLNSEDPWEKVALTHLRKWNYRMDSDSAAALIFHYTLIHLLEMAFGDKLGAIKEGYFGVGISPLFLLNSLILRAQTRLLELLNDHETSIWYMDAARGRQRTREELLQEALSRAVRSIRAELGDSAQRWHWGRVHQVRYGHPMGGVRMLRAIFNRGPIPVGGDGATPNQTFSTPQLPPGLVQVMASYRQIYEVGVWDRAQTVTTSGQSGHPLSEHYDDQILLWREGVYHPMPWSREEAEKATRYRMLLERGGET